jgi:hypothetical protein
MKSKLYKCKQCSKEFKQNNSLHVICSYTCYAQWTNKKEIEKRLKEYKINVVKLSDLESLAKIQFQKWVRKRDENLPCISCGTSKTNQWDGSHYLSAEQYSGVIFNEMNVNKACCYCNRNLYGNPIEYRKGMIKKYGLFAVEGLEELANETRHYKFTKDELIEIAKNYKQLNKQ